MRSQSNIYTYAPFWDCFSYTYVPIVNIDLAEIPAKLVSSHACIAYMKVCGSHIDLISLRGHGLRQCVNICISQCMTWICSLPTCESIYYACASDWTYKNIIYLWKLGLVWKYKNLFRPQLKVYGSVDFTLTYLSMEIRVNETQTTDTTLVHKYE